MAQGQHFLQIPGPSPVPERIQRAIDRQVIDHRGPDFQKLGHEVLDGLHEGDRIITSGYDTFNSVDELEFTDSINSHRGTS